MSWKLVVISFVVFLIITVLKFESVEVKHSVSVKIKGRKLLNFFKKGEK
jgi:hypothetical protein